MGGRKEAPPRRPMENLDNGGYARAAYASNTGVERILPYGKGKESECLPARTIERERDALIRYWNSM